MKACYFSAADIDETKVTWHCVPTGKVCKEEDFAKCNLFQELYRETIYKLLWRGCCGLNSETQGARDE